MQNGLFSYLCFMKYTTTHTICYSPTRTSAEVAAHVTRGTAPERIVETDLTCDRDTRPIRIGNELAVIAAPVYAGRIAPVARERFSRLQGEGTPAILLAVYGNRDYEDALIELRDLAVSRGFVPLAAGAFIGEHSYSRPGMPVAEGRPDRSDLAAAESFGRQAAEKLASVSSPADLPAVTVPGNIPYKEVKPSTPAAPVTLKENCTACGLCIELCPTAAIRFDDEGEIATDPLLCTKCCACVKECPNQARIFDTPYTAMLHTNFSARREPETFL